LAGKDGPAAVSATMELTDPQLRRRVFTSVMEAWAQNNPGEASAWYFAPEQAALRSSVELVAGPRVARTIIRPAALNDLDDAVGLIAELAHPTEVWGALDALDTVADLLNVPADQLATKLAGVEKHARVIETFRQTQALRKVLDQSPDASPPLDALRGIIAEKLGEPTGLDLRGLSIPRSRTD
jgi:hypothetical protein